MPARIDPLRITAWTVQSAVGDRAQTRAALRERRTGLRPNDFGKHPIATWIGRVPHLESQSLPKTLERWDCRNNRLAWRSLINDGFHEAVARAITTYGADRIAVVVGTSTSSIGASEEAYCRLDDQGHYPPDLRRQIIHTPHSLGDFVQHALGLKSVCVTVATACSSSAKVFAQAERLLRLGVADAAVVGGVDTLCGSILFGFNSLELVAPDLCKPFDAHRNGINLGEASGFALLERGPGDGPLLVGYGESSDAHHMSSPHPEGVGARLAIQDALARANLAAEQIDYINLHGTASRKNDEVEAAVVAALFPETTFASSTKGWTGHTLGAAGMLEAAMCWLALESGEMPGTLNTETLDPFCGPQIQCANQRRSAHHALSFSFGFGGSNCVLAFARGATS
jgi:3-oxoacyl-[acyl-carrier-protein] synthase I